MPDAHNFRVPAWRTRPQQIEAHGSAANSHSISYFAAGGGVGLEDRLAFPKVKRHSEGGVVAEHLMRIQVWSFTKRRIPADAERSG